MKTFLVLLVGLFSFVVTIVGALAVTGNLTQDKIRGLWDKEALAEAQAKEHAEAEANSPTLGTLAQQLKQREKDLETRKIALDEREKQLLQREADLEKTRAELETLQNAINQSLDENANARTEQLKTVAITLENMDAETAAKSLESMPTDEAAEILLSVKDKQRGEILEAMTTESAARVIKEIRDAR